MDTEGKYDEIDGTDYTSDTSDLNQRAGGISDTPEHRRYTRDTSDMDQRTADSRDEWEKELEWLSRPNEIVLTDIPRPKFVERRRCRRSQTPRPAEPDEPSET